MVKEMRGGRPWLCELGNLLHFHPWHVFNRIKPLLGLSQMLGIKIQSLLQFQETILLQFRFLWKKHYSNNDRNRRGDSLFFWQVFAFLILLFHADDRCSGLLDFRNGLST